DSVLGWQNLRARWMDPATGRFITRDVFEGGIASPRTLHGYGFVANNPVNFADPSGYCEDPGGPGLRLCLETFIPDAVAVVPVYQSTMGIITVPYVFAGDNRGPSSDSGAAFRTRHLVQRFGTA